MTDTDRYIWNAETEAEERALDEFDTDTDTEAV